MSQYTEISGVVLGQFEYCHGKDENDPCDSPNFLKQLRITDVIGLVISYQNINSLRKKFDQLKLLLEETINILVLAEFKIDSTFRNSQSKRVGFSIPHKFPRKRFSRGYFLMFGKIYLGKIE